jgi:hypothetical protein
LSGDTDDIADVAVRAPAPKGWTRTHRHRHDYRLEANAHSMGCVLLDWQDGVRVYQWFVRAPSFHGVCRTLRAARRAVERHLRERVTCSAIWVDTGKPEPARRTYAYVPTGILFCGHRHPDCFLVLEAWADRLTEEEKAAIGEEALAGRLQGFLTNRGRFVDRGEAAAIAKAAGQIERDLDWLSSEDLY